MWGPCTTGYLSKKPPCVCGFRAWLPSSDGDSMSVDATSSCRRAVACSPAAM